MKWIFRALLAAFGLSLLFIAIEVHAAQTTVQPSNGGTGLTTNPSYGQVLLGNSSGGYSLVATSSLGISGGSNAVTSVFGRTGAVTAQSGDYTTSQVTEGSNLYYTLSRWASALAGTTTDALAEGVNNLYFTNARADARFVTDLAGTTSVKSVTTLPSLSLPYTQLTGTPDLSQYFTLSAWYGTTTDGLREGSTNLYFTNARVDSRFVTDLAATSSVKSITTLPSLSLPYSQLTGTPTIASSTLLSDNNTFSGTDSFTNASSNFGGTWQTFSPSHFQVAGSYDTFAWPFTAVSYGVSTSTTVGFTNGIVVNASSTITQLGNLSTNGFVKTTGSNGTLTVDTTSYTPTTRNINTTYPLQGGADLSADRTLSLAFGTSTSNAWNQLNTFTNATSTLASIGTLWLTGITGSTQCLHVDANGKVSGTGSDCGTGSGGVTSVSQTYGSAQTGAITVATSSALTFNGLTLGQTITNSSGTFTFTPTLTGTLNNSGLTNYSLSVTAGSGLIGGGSVSLGNSVTLTAQLATSAVPTVGQVPYVTNAGTPTQLGFISTSSETCSGVVNCPTHTVLSGGGAISLTGGSNGQVLAWLSGVPTWTATTTFATSTPSTGGWGFAFNNGTQTLAIPQAGANTPYGLLSSSDWTTFNNKQNAGTYLTGLGNYATTTGTAISISTSTATVNGLTYGNTIVVSANGLLVTPTVTGTYTGQAGSVANAVTFNNSGSGASSGQTYNGSAATTISYNTLGAVPTTRNVNTSYPLSGGGALSGDLTLAFNGIGSTSPWSAGQLAEIGNGNTLFGISTTTASCTGNATCSSFTVLGSSPVTINVAAGTAASSTLLSDNNTFSGSDVFSNGLLVQGSTTINGNATTTGMLGIGSLFMNGTKLTAVLGAIGPTGQLMSGPFITVASSSAGSDFAITGSSNTLTFQLPSASASARGLLTSSDWNTFNNKISSSSLSAGAGISYNSSTGVITNTIGYPFPSNATSTLLSLTGGLTAYASSTIGNGTQTGGLTISGGATTTGIAYFNNDIVLGTSTASTLLTMDANDNTAFSAGSSGYANQITMQNDSQTNNSGVQIRFRTTDSGGTQKTAAALFAGFSSHTANAVSSFLDFGVTNAGSWIDALRVANTGLVGIGSTSPYARLSIHANNGDTNTTLFAIGSSTASATTTLLSVDNTGTEYVANALGIGTAAPEDPFQIANLTDATMKFGGTSTQGRGILSYFPSSNKLEIDAYKGVVGYGTIYTQVPYFGIGSTTPGVLLGIGDSGSVNGINFTLGTSTFTGSAHGINLTSGCFAINGTCVGGSGGSGTVTSVGLSLPTGFAVTNSPVTTSGTLTATLNTGYSVKELPSWTVGAAGADYTTIQAALDQCGAVGGGSIYLVDPSYSQGATGLLWKGSNCSLWGRNAGTTTITFTGATTGIKTNSAAGQYTNDEIHGILFKGDATAGSIGVDWSNLTHGIVDDVQVINMGEMLHLNDTQNITFYNTFSNMEASTSQFCINASSTDPVNDNRFTNIFCGSQVANTIGVQLDNSNGNSFNQISVEPALTTGTVGLKIFDNTLATNDGVFNNSFSDWYIEANGTGVSIVNTVHPSGGGIQRNHLNNMSVEANTTDWSVTAGAVALNDIDGYDSNFGIEIHSFGSPIGIGTSTPLTTPLAATANAQLMVNASSTQANNAVLVGSNLTTYFKIDNSGHIYAPSVTTASAVQTGYWCYDANKQLIADSVACLSSAQRYKQNIDPLAGDALSTVMAIQPVTYYWKPDYNQGFQTDPNYDGQQVGFIADQVGSVDPRLMEVSTATTTFEGKVYPPGSPQTLNDRGMLAVLWSAVQEQQKEIQTGTVHTARSAEENWQWLAIGVLVIWNTYLTVRRRRR